MSDILTPYGNSARFAVTVATPPGAVDPETAWADNHEPDTLNWTLTASVVPAPAHCEVSIVRTIFELGGPPTCMLPRPIWARPEACEPLSHTQAAKLDDATGEDAPDGHAVQEMAPSNCVPETVLGAANLFAGQLLHPPTVMVT